MSQRIIKDSTRYPEHVPCGSIVKAEYEDINGEIYSMLYLLCHIKKDEYRLVSLDNGNRWNGAIPANKNNANYADAQEVLKDLNSHETAKLINTEVLGHISDIDFWNQLG